jgi:hypothetical protein
VRYAPVYFPGTVIVADASPVSIGASEERDGVDLTLRTVPTAEIRGTIVGLDSRPMAGVPVFLEGSIEDMTTISDESGRFVFRAVPPGNDVISARASSDRSSASNVPAGDLWAWLDVAVNGADQSGLTLALHPGMTVAGHVTFEGSTMSRPDPSRALIVLTPASNKTDAARPAQAPVDADGRFALAGLGPGRYHVNAVMVLPAAPQSATAWTLKSVLAQNQDLLDGTLEIAPGQNLDGLTVVFSDRHTDFSGTLFDSAGRPVAGYVVVIVPADRRFWTADSRRIRQASLGRDGHYDFADLPAGDYLLAAVTDVDRDDLSDPIWLDAVSAMAIPTALADGERKVLDIRLGKR